MLAYRLRKRGLYSRLTCPKVGSGSTAWVGKYIRKSIGGTKTVRELLPLVSLAEYGAAVEVHAARPVSIPTVAQD